MGDFILYLLYRLLGLLVNILPEAIAYQIGKRFGDLAYWILPKRRQLARKNLQLALDIDDSKVNKLVRANFQHLGMVLIEFLRLGQLTEENIDEFIEIEGLKYLKQAQQDDRGFVLFTGHFGNWEVMGAALALQGFPINALARDQSNELINEDILATRESKGINIFPNKGLVIKQAYRALKRGEGLFVLGDQKSRHAEHYVELFGCKALTRLGTVELAARTNSVVIPIYILRREDRGYKIIAKEPVEVPDNITDAEKKEIMSDLYNGLEEMIRKYPAQWMWMHDRWKGSPDIE
ncbi:lysophospholipid acyltransferase family protein [Acetohalobium arabaticum]|uniref:Lipid A biosynthesis acyltransferase n=1 Tax=Acetohalobium arabaticum (strain ATCC 49924 / DSM 5501 / Z-7288) TaxID=574087 RepID=D9QTU6_ACEAZ|nr:lysophospholipid acyltransferase family protein [Acetohalobium arabaticum]ADL13667.1 lipid A biosynthesis acyltransferase [Acetohalobium arabaticum DSM 5501]